jgi:hypothetical protein
MKLYIKKLTMIFGHSITQKLHNDFVAQQYADGM